MNSEVKVKNIEQEFLTLIRSRLGIEIHTHQIKELHKVIMSACEKFKHQPEEYLEILKHCTHDSPLLEYLISGITVGETYFFRDKHQMQLLEETILPALIEEKRQLGNLSLRIWSAGCATGEELYTIAMLLCEMLPDIHSWTCQLLGSDLNTKSLQKALAGVYGEWSMRSISPYYKQHYFSKERDRYHLSEKIKDMANFIYLNLNDDAYPSILNGTNTQDLIFCRNVLIYFSRESAGQIMKKMEASLIPGGYLLLGASDPINIENSDLIFHHQKGTLFSRPKILWSPPIVPSSSPKKLSIPKPVIIPIATPPVTVIEDVSAKAIALANLGKLEEAFHCCQDKLRLDSTNKELYFISALILIELNQFKEAEAALRKTLFLDHHFVPGHFQLGLLLLKNKQQEAGLKSLKNALKTAEKKHPSQSVEGCFNLNYGRLVEILKQEILLYSGL